MENYRILNLFTCIAHRVAVILNQLPKESHQESLKKNSEKSSVLTNLLTTANDIQLKLKQRQIHMQPHYEMSVKLLEVNAIACLPSYKFDQALKLLRTALDLSKRIRPTWYYSRVD